MTPIIPYDVVSVLKDVLEARLNEHLEQIELERGLKPGTLLRPAFHRMAAPNSRLRTMKAPCALIGAIKPDLTDEADATLSGEWQVLIELYVEGRPLHRNELILQRDVLALTIIECVLQRTPLGEDKLIGGITFVDLDIGDTPNAANSEMLAAAQIDFAVQTPEVLRLNGLPPHDSPLAAGSPGGPPQPGRAAIPWPELGHLTDNIDREAPDGNQ